MAVTAGSRLMGWKVKVSTEEDSGRSQDEVALRMSVTDRHHWLDSTRKTGGGSRYAPANYLMEKKIRKYQFGTGLSKFTIKTIDLASRREVSMAD